MSPHLLLSVRIAGAIAVGGALMFGFGGFNRSSHTPEGIQWAALAGAMQWGSVGALVTFFLALGACLLLRHTWHFLLARIADLSGAIRGERPDLDDP